MIDIKNITKSFGNLQVLKDINLHINKGEVVSIVGPSGAGKTTLLQIIGTLDKPDSGTICLDGIDVNKLSTRKLSDFRNQHIGFVFQFHQLLPEFTALENIMIPAYIAGKSNSEAKQRALELLEFMGLSDRANHKPAELSGGEKALTAISLLFAIQNLKPSPFALLDEIEAALDDSNVDRFAKYLHKLTDHTQFIVITHRRGTMVAADRLYGITMQEKGVSTLVSVNLIEESLT